VISIQKDKRPVERAGVGEQVCLKIAVTTAQRHISLGRQFDATHELYSAISRESIDIMKEWFLDELDLDDLTLLKAMKTLFKIR